jgi:hypothetical protein
MKILEAQLEKNVTERFRARLTIPHAMNGTEDGLLLRMQQAPLTRVDGPARGGHCTLQKVASVR